MAVITYNTGGSLNTIDHNTGFVIPKGDIKVLAQTIITNIEKATEMGEMVRKPAGHYLIKTNVLTIIWSHTPLKKRSHES